MASVLLKYITPPPVNLSPDYEGTEYRWKFLTIRPACQCRYSYNTSAC